LLIEKGKESVINDVYKKAKADLKLPKEKIKNHVKEIYKPFTAEQISTQISKMLKTPQIKAELEIVYQSIEDLHKACPNDLGDWYFTGNYPTPGGNKVANTSFINYIEGKDIRSY
jgi:amidophosphoribosyltransferase